MKLYENIRNRRIELDMSQDELARRLGYTSRSMICKVESGRVDLPSSKIVEFAKALQTEPEYLMGIEKDRQASLTDLQKQVVDYVVSLPEEKLEALYEFLRRM